MLCEDKYQFKSTKFWKLHMPDELESFLDAKFKKLSRLLLDLALLRREINRLFSKTGFL